MVSKIKGDATSTFGSDIDVTGNVVTDAPAFSATFASDYSFSHNTWQKIPFSTEEFDTNSDYDHSTNYRFTPSVEGYYLINLTARVNYTGTAGTQVYNLIYKNGSPYTQSEITSASGTKAQPCVTALIYMNGNTDYVEGYVRTNNQSPFIDANVGNGSSLPKFQGVLVRAV